MTTPRLAITVLVENSAGGKGLLAEHGLSFWIDYEGQRVLLDSGQGPVLRHNAARLDIPLQQADALVLSHGHFDHTGGLPDALALTGEAPVYVHGEAFVDKYTRNPDGSARYIGMDEEIRQALHASGRLRLLDGPAEVVPGVWCTGPIPRTNDFEDRGGPFFIDSSCRDIDEILDDQALFMETAGGIVVVLGCAHAGVINTLAYIRSLTDSRPVAAVLGGMHLLQASSRRLEETLTALQELDVARLMPCHCTGFTAMARLWQAFPERFEQVRTGSVFTFAD